MDMEFLKSIPEDQMELMMMMQLDKLPEFCGVYADLSDNPSTERTSTPNHKLIIPNNMMITTHDDRVTTSSHFGPYINSPNSSSTNISFTGSGQVHSAPSPGGGETSAGTSRWLRGYDGELLELGGGATQEQKRNSMAAMREMIFRIAAMQPIHIDPESVKPPKRRNVKISKDPQSVAARHRRERISERIRILQRLVPGGTKMDTASMLDEAIHYVKFLKNQVQSLERAAVNRPPPRIAAGIGFPVPMSSYSTAVGAKGYQSTTYCPN